MVKRKVQTHKWYSLVVLIKLTRCSVQTSTSQLVIVEFDQHYPAYVHFPSIIAVDKSQQRREMRPESVVEESLCFCSLVLCSPPAPDHNQSDNNWRSVENCSRRLSSATGPSIRWRSGHRSELRNLFRARLSRCQGLRSAARLKILTLLDRIHY